ncbi:MAG: hypothetical protein ACXWKN_06920 [Phenylobacterium sp.]
MKIIMLAAGTAAIALSAGLASAAPAVTGPKQPIPYAELTAYMKASPKVRAHKDWWSGQTASAETGATADTSATARSLPADTAGAASSATSATPPSLGGETKEAAPQLQNSPPVNAPAPGAVNPPATATPGAPPTTTPPT